MRVLCRAVALGIAIVATMAPAANAARTRDFDADWRFALVNRDAATDPTGAFARAAEPGFDDSSWRALDLPHDWSIELLPTPTGGTTAGTGFFQGGLGWYRKTFTLPPSARGKRISVESTASTWIPRSTSTAAGSGAIRTATPGSPSS